MKTSFAGSLSSFCQRLCLGLVVFAVAGHGAVAGYGTVAGVASVATTLLEESLTDDVVRMGLAKNSLVDRSGEIHAAKIPSDTAASPTETVARINVHPTGVSAHTAIPATVLTTGGNATQVDLSSHFSFPGIEGMVVQFDTVLGKICGGTLSARGLEQCINFSSLRGEWILHEFHNPSFGSRLCDSGWRLSGGA